MGFMTYKPSETDSVLVFKNGGFGFNPLNSNSEKELREKIIKCTQLKINRKTNNAEKNKQ